VVSGRIYYINAGAGGVSSTNNGTTVPGGDSWFSASNVVTSALVLAKGGAGGQSIVNIDLDTFGTGGSGTTNGSIGDVVRAGGSGATSTTNAFGGGGGGSAGTLSAGNAPASATNGLGAVAVTGGGNGGNANASAGGSGDGQSPTGSPGGGGGGARAASATQRYGGAGAAGQIVLTVQAIAKVDQSITFGALSNKTYGDSSFALTATASSGLAITYTSSDPSVASILGSTVTILKAGSTTITASQSGNDNYNAASSVPQTLTVSAASGTTFAGLFGTVVNPTNVGLDGLAYLMKYALGGTNTNDSVSLPMVSQNGTTLTMTAIVRTNDTNLTIVGQSVADLSSTWSDLASNRLGVASSNSNNVPAGCQRRDFSVNGGTNNRTFLRLKATQP